jgi:hypothetical protein
MIKKPKTSMYGYQGQIPCRWGQFAIPRSVVLAICISIAIFTITKHFALPAPICNGRLEKAYTCGNGKYIVATFLCGNIVIWDVEKIWDKIKPSRIYWFYAVNQGANTPISVSRDAKTLAWVYTDTAKKQDIIAIDEMAPGLPTRLRIPTPMYQKKK